jgi:hypothetical protein
MEETKAQRDVNTLYFNEDEEHLSNYIKQQTEREAI